MATTRFRGEDTPHFYENFKVMKRIPLLFPQKRREETSKHGNSTPNSTGRVNKNAPSATPIVFVVYRPLQWNLEEVGLETRSLANMKRYEGHGLPRASSSP